MGRGGALTLTPAILHARPQLVKRQVTNCEEVILQQTSGILRPHPPYPTGPFHRVVPSLWFVCTQLSVVQTDPSFPVCSPRLLRDVDHLSVWIPEFTYYNHAFIDSASVLISTTTRFHSGIVKRANKESVAVKAYTFSTLADIAVPLYRK